MTEAQSTNTNQNPTPQITTFIRPSADFNSSQKLTNAPLNGQNYIPWAKAAKITLKGKGLLGYVNGNRKKPKEGVEAQDEWDMVDSQVITLISNSLEPKLSETFYCETAAELWQAIENQFSNKNSHSQIYHIKKEITQITQESKSIPELVGHVRAKYEELKLYRPPTTDLTVLQEREETDRVYTFLAALDNSYEAIRAQLLLSTEKLTFNDVAARVQNEATRRVAMNPSTNLDTAENKAYAARNPNSTHLSEPRPRGAPSNDERCDHCKKLGHTRDGCWFLHPHLRPNRGKEEKGSGARKGGWSKGEKRFGGVSKGAENPREEKGKWIGSEEAGGEKGDSSGLSVAPTAQLAHILNQLSSLMQQQKGPILYHLNSLNNSIPLNSSKINYISQTNMSSLCQNTSTWIIDSGATDHMTNNMNKLQSFTKTKNPQFVTIANGNKVQISGFGAIDLFSKNINNILYLPSFSSNLLSVGKITQDLNCNVIFSPDKVVFQDRSSGKKIGEGQFKNGLYYLDKVINSCFVSSSPISREKLLHWRFGHPSDQVLNSLFCCNLNSSNCDICKFSKQTRLPFSLSTSVSKNCFELIHSDVWGPAPIDSYNQFKYFVTFIDDYSRTTWLYLLKTKNEVFLYFQELYNYLKNQYNANIKIFRSDNGTEYVNRNFSEFFKQKGILHQTTCVNTPQQNGISERKNRHLLEVTRSLLFQGNVPQRYWSNAVLTATYLINRLPSAKLKNMSPLEILKNRNINLDHIRVFGCSCFVHIKGNNKLDA